MFGQYKTEKIMNTKHRPWEESMARQTLTESPQIWLK